MAISKDFLSLFKQAQRIRTEEGSDLVAKAMVKDRLVHEFGLRKEWADAVAIDVLKGDDTSFNALVGKYLDADGQPVYARRGEAAWSQCAQCGEDIHPMDNPSGGRRWNHVNPKHDFNEEADTGHEATAIDYSKEPNDDLREPGMYKVLSKVAKEFVIYGPASVAITDRENDVITGPALRKALPQLLKRARLSLQHLDILVGEIVDKWIDPDGREWVTDVRPVAKEDFNLYPWLQQKGVKEGDEALFIVGKIYDDAKFSLDVRKQIERGELNSFSVSGQATAESRKMDCAGYACKLVNEISGVDLSAVTVCKEGMNPAAKFIVIAKAWESDSALISQFVQKDASVEVLKYLPPDCGHCNAGCTCGRAALKALMIKTDVSDPEFFKDNQTGAVYCSRCAMSSVGEDRPVESEFTPCPDGQTCELCGAVKGTDPVAADPLEAPVTKLYWMDCPKCAANPEKYDQDGRFAGRDLCPGHEGVRVLASDPATERTIMSDDDKARERLGMNKALPNTNVPTPAETREKIGQATMDAIAKPPEVKPLQGTLTSMKKELPSRCPHCKSTAGFVANPGEHNCRDCGNSPDEPRQIGKSDPCKDGECGLCEHCQDKSEKDSMFKLSFAKRLELEMSLNGFVEKETYRCAAGYEHKSKRSAQQCKTAHNYVARNKSPKRGSVAPKGPSVKKSCDICNSEHDSGVHYSDCDHAPCSTCGQALGTAPKHENDNGVHHAACLPNLAYEDPSITTHDLGVSKGNPYASPPEKTTWQKITGQEPKEEQHIAQAVNRVTHAFDVADTHGADPVKAGDKARERHVRHLPGAMPKQPRYGVAQGLTTAKSLELQLMLQDAILKFYTCKQCGAGFHGVDAMTDHEQRWHGSSQQVASRPEGDAHG
jgi:hypothetical protein